jgi:hypothetical protein
VCAAASFVKLGLFVPAALHARMITANAGKPRGALQADYAVALAALLDAIDGGHQVVFAAVRGPKRRVTVRLTQALSQRLRARVDGLNLKITDFACTAIDRHVSDN